MIKVNFLILLNGYKTTPANNQIQLSTFITSQYE
jgi:hypothetical protein